MAVDVAAATPIEVYTFTPGDYARWVFAWMGVTLLAVAFTAWVLWPRRESDVPAEVDSPEAADTVELPRRRSGLRTAGTIHAPQYQRSADDDATVAFERAETRR
ncbi:hypothetical protein [Micromonospora profundi]|uniref:hypothetical protein n=1 Tax=Micromonospora profundi TaxID=1420889 RepID=UPI00366130CC